MYKDSVNVFCSELIELSEIFTPYFSLDGTAFFLSVGISAFKFLFWFLSVIKKKKTHFFSLNMTTEEK